MRHILAVARNQSFSRAAEEEGITQPALSRSIAAFELRHGLRLFDRGRGGVRPTPAGLLVIDQATKVLAAVGDLERSLRHYPDGEVERIAFGLGPLLSSLFLPRLASTLLARFPGIQMVAMTDTPVRLVSDLLADRIELIIGNNWNMGRVSGTEVERIGALELGVMVRSSHPLAKAPQVTTAQLEDYPVASAVEPTSGGFQALGGSFVNDNFHVLRETVLQTDCVWMSSPAFVADDLRAGRLVQLPLTGPAVADTNICLVSKRSRTPSSASVALVGAVRLMLDQAASTLL
ncbi:LysR family transcriptional regulator [Novosphingobium sp. M1R2S20]|uniref:LysR family transcriptional regulator n=1 Tax=Novosphingobium rhizovicinum TaxID=3228928 RepID=A0ABV3REH6_9SPHN